MKLNKLNEFTKGWIIGNFNPSLFETDEFEVAVKNVKVADPTLDSTEMAFVF